MVVSFMRRTSTGGGIGHRLATVRWHTARHESDLGQPQRLHQFERRPQVTVVNRVERTAENAYWVHACMSLFRVCTETTRLMPLLLPVAASARINLQLRAAARPMGARAGRP